MKARGILTAAYHVLHVLPVPGVPGYPPQLGYPYRNLAGGVPTGWGPPGFGLGTPCPDLAVVGSTPGIPWMCYPHVWTWPGYPPCGQTDGQTHVKQGSPPAWTQEAYRPPHSDHSFCCPNLVPSPGRVPPQAGYPPAGYPLAGYPPTLAGYPPAGARSFSCCRTV